MLQLIFNICFYCFCIFTRSINLISLTPKFAVSVCKLHITPFLEYQKSTFTFQISHKSRNAHFGRDAYQQMYVIWTNFSFYYLYTFPSAQLSQYFSYLHALIFKKYFPSVLGRKHYVILAISPCVC